nr:hypothetical protein [Tanacetum cinerariifolium]
MQKVKDKIDRKEGIPSWRQMLYFRGKRFTDESTMLERHINNGSILDLLLARWGGLMQVFINTSNGRSISVEVRETKTVGHLKVKIQDEFQLLHGIRPYEMILLYNGTKLHNRHTLADLLVIQRGYMKVSVKAAFTRKTIKTLKLQSCQNISFLKALIEETEAMVIRVPTMVVRVPASGYDFPMCAFFEERKKMRC